MKKLNTLLVAFAITTYVSAQENATRFYATMSLNNAEALQKDSPNDIQIIAQKRNEAAVYMTEEVHHKLHQRILTHGPGYIFRSSEEDALKALRDTEKKAILNQLPFTITEDEMVERTVNNISTQNIENHIKELEDYGSRYHTLQSATQSAEDLKTKWEGIAASYGRTDISVRLVNHANTPMPSVVLTINGSEFPDEYVIVGGHLDSTSFQGNNDAPGADDDASGIATITEAMRALLEAGFVPKRTIEVMAYAAEEIGLVGSAEIAKEYRENNVNVIAVGQFDMTNYNGSAKDIYFIEDFTDASLTTFFKELIDHYNTSGVHTLTYGTALCNYGCSDHASWNDQGYKASFPFEANFSASNPNIHTRRDTYNISGTAEHATKFAKLCSEFLIEVAKNNTGILSVDDFSKEGYTVYVENNMLYYNSGEIQSPIKTIDIYDTSGKRALQKSDLGTTGGLSLKNLSTGVYVITMSLENTKQMSKKIVIN